MSSLCSGWEMDEIFISLVFLCYGSHFRNQSLLTSGRPSLAWEPQHPRPELQAVSSLRLLRLPEDPAVATENMIMFILVPPHPGPHGGMLPGSELGTLGLWPTEPHLTSASPNPASDGRVNGLDLGLA